MNIRKLIEYKSTPGLNLDQIPLNDLIELTAVAFDEFTELFDKGGEHASFFSPGSPYALKHGISLLRKFAEKNELTKEKYNEIVIGAVMLAKAYQNREIHCNIYEEILVEYYKKNFLSDQTINDVTEIVNRKFASSPNDEHFIRTILCLGESVMAKKVHIDESAYLTGGEDQKITALSVILKHILEKNVDVKPYESFDIGKRIAEAAKGEFLAEAVSVHNSRELYQAAKKGDLELVNTLLDSGTVQCWYSSREDNPFRSSILDIAAIYRHTEVFKALLTKLSLSEQAVAEGIKHVIIAYKEAVQENKSEDVTKLKELLDYILTTRFINYKTRKGNNALHLALVHGNHAYAAALVNAGVNINEINNTGGTPISIAAEGCGRTAKINNISAHPMMQLCVGVSFIKNIDDGDNRDDTCTQLIRFLLEHGADPNIGTNEDGESVLYSAVWENNSDAVRLILPHIKKSTDKNGEPWYVECIHASLDTGFNPKMLDLLKQHGAHLSHHTKKSYFNDICYTFCGRLFYSDNKNEIFDHMLDAFDYMLAHKAKLPDDSKALILRLTNSYDLLPEKSKETVNKFNYTMKHLQGAIEKQAKKAAKASDMSLFKSSDEPAADEAEEKHKTSKSMRHGS